MGRCSDARDRLLATAARLIRERGYTAVSVAEICHEAGLHKGSFYHFFPSKRDLVLATLERYAEQYRATMQASRCSEASVAEQIAAVCRSIHDALTCAGPSMCGCPVGNLALEMADRDEGIRTKVEAIFAGWRDAFEAILSCGIARGELRLSDPQGVAEALVAYLQGAILVAKTHADVRTFDRLAGQAMALVRGAEHAETSVSLPSMHRDPNPTHSNEPMG